MRKGSKPTTVAAHASNDLPTISTTGNDTHNGKELLLPSDSLSQHTPPTPIMSTLADPRLKATSRAPLVQSSAASGRESRASSYQLNRSPSNGRSGSTIANAPSRPQFAAHQQHFSPRKPAPTSSHGANRSSDSRDGPNMRSNSSQLSLVGEKDIQADLPVHLVRIQDELLQLQMLYDGSQDSLQSFQHHTDAELGRQFIALQADATRLDEEEGIYSASFNTAAVHTWLDQEESGGVRKAQALSQLINDIDDLTRFDGRHARVVAEFEKWLDGMLQAAKRRSGDLEADAVGHASSGLLVQPLGPGWCDEVALLLRKLGTLSQILDDLGTATSGSRVQSTLSTEKLFVDNLLGELNHATAIEAAALRRQQTWIDSAVENLLDEQGNVLPPMNRSEPKEGVWATRPMRIS